MSKSPSPASLSDTGRLSLGLHTTISSPSWTAPTYSAHSHRRGAAVLLSALWPPLDLLHQFHVLLMLGSLQLDTALQVRFQLQSTSEQSSGAESTPSTCWPHCPGCSPGFHWFCGLWVHISEWFSEWNENLISFFYCLHDAKIIFILSYIRNTLEVSLALVFKNVHHSCTAMCSIFLVQLW